MGSVRISDALLTRYDRLAEDLDGFDGTADLVEHVLAETAAELEQTAPGSADVDDQSVEQRLRDLGYVDR